MDINEEDEADEDEVQFEEDEKDVEMDDNNSPFQAEEE